MISCEQSYSLTAAPLPCTPDVGPPTPANWSDPQPAGLVVTGYDPTAFTAFPVCPAGTATLIWDGSFPVRATTGPATLVYTAAGGNFFVFQPFFVDGQSCIMSVTFLGVLGWVCRIRCESSVQDFWVGTKAVGLTPVGTYMQAASVGSATGPACLHIAESNMDWSSMVWVPTLVQPTGTATASGAGPNFAVSATTPDATTNFGQILGTMTYTGPQKGVRVRITVTGADTGGFSSFRVRVNGSTLTVTPAVGFAVGVTDHYFTIFDPANPSSPLVGATIEIRAIAQTNVPGNSPAFSGVLT